MKSRLARLTILVAAGFILEAQPQIPHAQWWISHTIGDLMPFWHQPAAWGNPWGDFATTRCDDGTLFDRAKPCPEIGSHSWLRTEWTKQYLVALSRQTYAYGVFFHITGDPTFMDLMRAGVAYLRSEVVDRENGGMKQVKDTVTGKWDANHRLRDPQQLAYGLLGMSFYYYLTRDDTVLEDVIAVKRYIWKNYYNEKLDALQWTLDPPSPTQPAESRRLTAQLDQMNAYMVMMTPLLPAEEQEQWKSDLMRLTRIMKSQFYVEKDNLFFLRADSPADLDIEKTGTDFGHSIKALWMMRMAGLMAGDQDLVLWAEEKGRGILDRAYQEDCGCWASGVLAGGALDLNKSWWIYAELDQFAASVALSDSSFARYLPRTYDFWLNRFVDKTYGEVWTTVDGRTHLPLKNNPKQWPWKNGYHSLEHALVSYITTLQQYGEPVTLYYNFTKSPAPETIRPYYYSGSIESIGRSTDWRGGEIQKVVFRDVR